MCAYAIEHRVEPLKPEVACVAGQLDMVEARLAQAVSSEVVSACNLALHLLEAGGKRIRPRLVLLSAGACGAEAGNPRVLDFATSVELVHTASLVHDDVVDETRERRGVSTANGKWGNKISVLGGDFLLARAFSILASINETEVTEVLSATAVRMTESEVLQAECEGDVEGWRANYWTIIYGKTAAFMSCCCECGAILAGAPPEVRAALADYGANIGVAFQITDDLLDILGDAAETGKDVGSDLMHGKFTMPVLLAIENAAGSDRERLLSLVEREYLSADEAREVTAIVTGSGAAGLAHDIAVDYAGKAESCLSCLPQSDYTLGLSALAASTADRVA